MEVYEVALMMNQKPEQVRSILEQLSVQDFLKGGINQGAYIRPAPGGEYAVHAADGTVLSLAQSFDMAIAAVRHNDMHPVTVQ